MLASNMMRKSNTRTLQPSLKIPYHPFEKHLKAYAGKVDKVMLCLSSPIPQILSKNLTELAAAINSLTNNCFN